jgi:TP901-1 family phage major tail protein
MSAQKGRDLLLKLDSTGTSTFITVGGLRTRTLSLGSETVDVTHSESPGQWRELLSGAGTRRARIAGAGVFRDEASDAAVRELAFSGAVRAWRVVIPDFGTVEGAFQVTALEYSGAHDGALAFDLTLESAGALTFTAG